MSGLLISIVRKMAVLIIAVAILKMIPHGSVDEFAGWLRGLSHQVTEQTQKIPTDKIVENLPKTKILPPAHTTPATATKSS